MPNTSCSIICESGWNKVNQKRKNHTDVTTLEKNAIIGHTNDPNARVCFCQGHQQMAQENYEGCPPRRHMCITKTYS